MINSLASVCPAQLTIQGHPLVLIATDGEPVHPVVVNTVISFSGKLWKQNWFYNCNKIYVFYENLDLEYMMTTCPYWMGQSRMSAKTDLSF